MPTRFQTQVYEAVKRIPRGKVATYASVAGRVGCRSCRAVGQALRRNPFAPVVPCHRVIASDMSLGGFNGQRSGPELGRKLKLLRREGVTFQAGKLADPRRIYAFPTRS